MRIEQKRIRNNQGLYSTALYVPVRVVINQAGAAARTAAFVLRHGRGGNAPNVHTKEALPKSN
jgi:hypothetical protein